MHVQLFQQKNYSFRTSKTADNIVFDRTGRSAFFFTWHKFFDHLSGNKKRGFLILYTQIHSSVVTPNFFALLCFT